MKERPILFSGAMVRALLDGSKTQTRRVIKSAGVADAQALGPKAACCPYAEGQKLWVRETWAQPTTLDPGPTFYRADYPEAVHGKYENLPPADAITWRPSIHMPRALSRITLEVTCVSVERLQSISEADAYAEGTFAGVYEYDNGEGTETARESYQFLWDSLNAARGYGWDVNPWVWVVEFRRVEA
jgi:hypothetical protein